MFPVRVGFVDALCCTWLFVFAVIYLLLLLVVMPFWVYFGGVVCSCARFCGVRCLLNAGFALCCYSWYC